MKELADEIWQLVYKSFNRPNEVLEMAAVIGSTSVSSQVGHLLLNDVASLREGNVSQELIDKIRGNVLLAETSNWMTPDISDKIQILLDKLSTVK